MPHARPALGTGPSLQEGQPCATPPRAGFESSETPAGYSTDIANPELDQLAGRMRQGNWRTFGSSKNKPCRAQFSITMSIRFRPSVISRS